MNVYTTTCASRCCSFAKCEMYLCAKTKSKALQEGEEGKREAKRHGGAGGGEFSKSQHRQRQLTMTRRSERVPI